MQISGIFSKKILPNLNGGFLCVLACMFCTPFPAMAEDITLQLEGHYNYMLRYEGKCESTGIAYSCATGTENDWYVNGDALNGVGTMACVHLEFDRSITRNNKTYLLNCRNVIEMSSSSLGCKPANCSSGTTPSGSQIYDGCWDTNGGAAISQCYSSSCTGPATGTDTTCPQLCWSVGVCSGRYNYPGVGSNGNLSCQAGCVFTCPEGQYGKPWVRPSIVTGDATEWANTAAASMSCKQPNEAGWYLPPGKNYYLPDYRYTDCMSGWYDVMLIRPGSGSTTWACAQCAAPKPGETNAGVVSDVGENNGITSCYIPGNTRFSDESGSGRYLQNCSYVQGN